jgi:hypothetical protein
MSIMSIVAALLIIALIVVFGAYAALIAVGLGLLAIWTIVGFFIGRILFIPITAGLATGILFLSAWSPPILLFVGGMAYGAWCRAQEQLN